MGEFQNRTDVHSQMRTISEAGDVDFFKIIVAPYSAGRLIDSGMGTLNAKNQYSYEIQDENATLQFSGTSSVGKTFTNTTDTAVTYYLKVFATDGVSIGGYVTAYISYGEDRDDDGYYTKDSRTYDPDDNDPLIPN